MESAGGGAAVPRPSPLRRGARWCVRRGAGRGAAQRPQCCRLPPAVAASPSPWRCAVAPRSSCRPRAPRRAAPGPPRPSSGNGGRGRWGVFESAGGAGGAEELTGRGSGGADGVGPGRALRGVWGDRGMKGAGGG